jgi:hypothetical protein
MSERDDIVRHWVHSHEEDTPNALVYRPDTYKFPPSRGRTALELHPDGTYVGADIGADDRPTRTTGNWSLNQDHQLTLTDDQARPRRTLEIAAVTPERLELLR